MGKDKGCYTTYSRSTSCHVCHQNMCSGRDQNSPGGVGGCGCGSVEEGELCELTCGTAAVEGGGANEE